MSAKTTVFLTAMFSLLLLSGLAGAQTLRLQAPAEEGGGPVSDALVYFEPLEGTNRGKRIAVFTDSTGSASLDGMPAQTLFQIAKLGYQPVSDTLNAGENREIYLSSSGLTLPPAVITAQATPLHVDQALHNIRVIDRAWIEAQGAISVRDVLSNALNIRVTQDNILGSIMTLQGLGGQNVKILVNDVPVVGRNDGNIDLSQLNLNDVDRIEIVEGPLAVQYGADALGGVINIITQNPPSRKWEAGARSYGETVGHVNADGFAGLKSGHHAARLSGGRNFFYGWSPTDRPRGHQWKPREQLFGAGTYSYQFKQGEMNYRFAALDEQIRNYGLPVTTPFTVQAFDEYYDTHRLDQSLRIRYNTSLWRWDVLAAGNYYDRARTAYRKDLVELKETSVTEPSAQDTSKFWLIMSRGSAMREIFSGKTQFRVGYEVNRETGEGDRISGGNKKMYEIAGFATIDFKPTPGLTLQTGFRWGYHSRYASPPMPALHIRWQISPDYTLRASYARGFRAPSLKELHLFFVDINHNIQGNESLEAETSHNLQASIKRLFMGNNWVITAEVAAYINFLRDMISLSVIDPERQMFKYVNLGRVHTNGLRADCNWVKGSFNLQAGGSINGQSTAISNGGKMPEMRYSPEVRLAGRYRIPKIRIEAAVFYKYTGRLNQVLQDSEGLLLQNWIDEFHTLDFTFSKYFWKEHVKVSVGGRNMFDISNVNAYSSASDAHTSGGSTAIATGRSWFLQLGVVW